MSSEWNIAQNKPEAVELLTTSSHVAWRLSHQRGLKELATVRCSDQVTRWRRSLTSTRSSRPRSHRSVCTWRTRSTPSLIQHMTLFNIHWKLESIQRAQTCQADIMNLFTQSVVHCRIFSTKQKWIQVSNSQHNWVLHYCSSFSTWTTRKMHHFQGYFIIFPGLSRTLTFNFQDFQDQSDFPGLSRSWNFQDKIQDFPGRVGTLQE